MRNSKAWPEVFSPGSAELLTRAALLAVLPMVAEEIRRAADAALADDEWCRAAFSSLIEGMKAPTEKVEG